MRSFALLDGRCCWCAAMHASNEPRHLLEWLQLESKGDHDHDKRLRTTSGTRLRRVANGRHSGAWNLERVPRARRLRSLRARCSGATVQWRDLALPGLAGLALRLSQRLKCLPGHDSGPTRAVACPAGLTRISRCERSSVCRSPTA